MKHFLQICRQTIVTGLILIGIVLSAVACAAVQPEQSNLSARTTIPTTVPQTSQTRTLPNSVAEAVLQDASSRLNLPREQLKIANTKQQSWPDGCLGLAEPGTFCPQIVVSGWKVTVQGRENNLLYRTDNRGSLVKLEK